ncbi:MAG: hypothetical protein ABIK31_07930, partial [candidate division WOR-3 bacterium]
MNEQLKELQNENKISFRGTSFRGTSRGDSINVIDSIHMKKIDSLEKLLYQQQDTLTKLTKQIIELYDLTKTFENLKKKLEINYEENKREINRLDSILSLFDTIDSLAYDKHK